jgi:Tfp pilus assembly protein PilX
MMRRLRQQAGFALPMALGIMFVLGIAVVAAIDYTSQNARYAAISKSRGSAYDIAEAGLNAAYSVLNNPANNPMDGTLLPQRTTQYNGGTATWSGTLNTTPPGGGNPTWTITSVGSIRNPFGGRPSTKTLTTQVVVNPSPYFQTQQNNAWSYDYSAKSLSGGCDQNITNSFGAPLYVTGNLCITNANGTTGWITAGPVAVWGQTSLVNSGNQVQSTGGGNISGSFQSALGCKYMAQAVHNPCRSGGAPNDNVWASQLGNSPINLPAPVADFNYWYVQAAPGPKVPCNPSKSSAPSTWPTFENETSNPTRNNSVGVVDLTPAGTSYDCYAGNGSNGWPLGELKWDATNNKLWIIGTVYIDGSAKISNASPTNITYTGWGSLYLTGSFYMNNTKLCAGISDPNCTFGNNAFSMLWQMMLVVADGQGTQPGVPSGDSVKLTNSSFEGLLYGTTQVETDINSNFEGPAVGSPLKFDGVVKPWTPTWFVPTGTPGNPMTSKTVVNPPTNFTG